MQWVHSKKPKYGLLFAKDCKYINQENYANFCLKYFEIGAKIYKLYGNWKTF